MNDGLMYNFQPADSISLALFSIFALAMAFVIYKVIFMTSDRKKWTIIFSVILGVFALAGLSGVIVNNFVPFGPMLFGMLFVFGIYFAFSKAGLEAANAFSFSVLIGFQGFRLLLELLLHHWATIGTIPYTMTWSGQNFDIITGVIALLAIPFVNKNSTVAMVVNRMGFILLLNVIRVVVMSSPLPIAWPLERPLLLVAYFPYNLIGPLFVLPALVGHLLVFRKLKLRANKLG